MMLNSHLCKNIHGMMRNVLQMAIEEDEANEYCVYSTGIDFEMKEEMQAMLVPKKYGK